MDEVTKKTLTVTVDQHESIVGMKRGRDTIYDVIDRLLIQEYRLIDLQVKIESLEKELRKLNVTIADLKDVMIKWS